MTEVYESVESFLRAMESASIGGLTPRMNYKSRLMTGPCGRREYLIYEAEAFFEKGNNLRLEVCCGELNGEILNDRNTAAVAADTHEQITEFCKEAASANAVAHNI
jgi:hypothetical protein